MTQNKSRIFSAFAVAAAVALGTAVAAQPAVAAAGLTVTPATGLADGASVTVTASGATAGETYYVAQCADLAGKHACATSTAGTFTADANGTASLSLKVAKTFDGVAPDGTAAGKVDCSAVQCYVGAGNANLDLGEVAISFS